MRLSFVSGHASLSAYSMWFCVVFLQQRMDTRNFRLVKPLIQVCCALFAVFTSLTRVSDYKHHPGDVLTGMVVGIFYAFMILIFLMDLFHRPRSFKTVEQADERLEGIDNDMEHSTVVDGVDGMRMRCHNRKASTGLKGQSVGQGWQKAAPRIDFENVGHVCAGWVG